jgi:DNA polymerase-3 subunit gamma/tau
VRTPERAETPAGRAAAPPNAAPSPPSAGSAAPSPSSSPPAAPAHATATPPSPSAPDAASPADPSPPHGLTKVSITAQVDGQPLAASADQAAAAVERELATEADPTPVVTAVATIDPDAPAPAPSLDLSFDTFSDSWPAVIDSLRSTKPMLAAALDDAAPAALAGDGLTIAWPESSGFLKRIAEDPANRDLIVKAIRSVTGTSLRLAYELRAAGDPVPAGAATAAASAPISDEDLVQRFKDEFDAEELPPEPEEQT